MLPSQSFPLRLDGEEMMAEEHVLPHLILAFFLPALRSFGKTRKRWKEMGMRWKGESTHPVASLVTFHLLLIPIPAPSYARRALATVATVTTVPLASGNFLKPPPEASGPRLQMEQGKNRSPPHRLCHPYASRLPAPLFARIFGEKFEKRPVQLETSSPRSPSRRWGGCYVMQDPWDEITHYCPVVM